MTRDMLRAIEIGSGVIAVLCFILWLGKKMLGNMGGGKP